MQKKYERKTLSHHVVAAALMAISAVVLSSLSSPSHAQINPKVMPAAGVLTKQTMSRLLLTDVARSGNRVIAVGDRGYIVFSDSNGESWERAKTPPNLPLLNSVYFADANTVWAVGHDSTILKSTDQGKEWTVSYSSAKDKRPFMDIVFTDANTGFAVGAYGAFYETTDGGKTWTSRKVIPPQVSVAKTASKIGKSAKEIDIAEDEQKTSDEDKHLNAIIKLADNRLFIAGEAGTMLISNDNGKTWSRIASPYKGSYFGAVKADDGALIVYGLRGNVYRASDANLSTWTQIETNTKASFMGATKLADGTIALVGLSGTLLLSKDAGKTFTALNTGTTKPLAAPVVAGANSLLIVGEAGVRDVLLTASAAVSAAAPAAASK
jgi:photosystem II stability/assembly factor-like uncharacterized protein